MALLQGVSRMKKGFLNALAMGILVFLITDVLSAAWQPTKLAAVAGYTGKGPVTDGSIDPLALFGGRVWDSLDYLSTNSGIQVYTRQAKGNLTPAKQTAATTE